MPLPRDPINTNKRRKTLENREHSFRTCWAQLTLTNTPEDSFVLIFEDRVCLNVCVREINYMCVFKYEKQNMCTQKI